jgi:hypothetical protein
MRALALALLLVGCGAAPAPPPTVHDRPATNGPARSFVEGTDLVVVLDHRAVRALPFAADVAALYAGSGLFTRLVGRTSLDVVGDLDVVAFGGRSVRWESSGLVASRWRGVLRYRIAEADAIGRIETAARAVGEPIAWRSDRGLRLARLPGEGGRDVPHAIVMSAPGEAVVFPEDELEVALATARDHEARRRLAGEAIEPALSLEDGVFARAWGTSLPARLTTHGATRAEGTARWASGRALVRIVIHFASTTGPTGLAADVTALLATVRGNPLLTTFGVAGWIDRLVLQPNGTDLVVETSGDAAEVSALCRLIGSGASL